MKESRVLQLVWQLTLFLFVAEVGYGMFAGSLGLISDGVHTAANCLGVGTSLFAVRWAKTFQSKAYSYDLGARAEVLAAFTNSVILLLLSAFLAFEAVHQLVEAAHHSDHSDHVAYVAFAGVVVNLFGLRLITPHIGGWKALGRRLQKQQEESNAPRLLNLEAVALHIVFDIVSSLGVILSTVLSEWGFSAADPLMAVLIAALTARAATPMFRRTSRTLAQATWIGFRPDPLLRELSSVDGVLEFYQTHFWSLAPMRNVGSLIVRVRADADDDAVLKAAHRIFSPSLASLTVQIEREKPIASLPSVSTAAITTPFPGPAGLVHINNGVPPVRKDVESVGFKEAAHLL